MYNIDEKNVHITQLFILIIIIYLFTGDYPILKIEYSTILDRLLV